MNKHCERNLPKAKIWLAIAAGLGLMFLLCGCASTQELFNRALERLQARLEEKADKPTDPEVPPIVAPDNKADEVAYASLRWDYGGFNGSNATLDPNVQISGLTNRGGKHLFYRWDKGLSAWGMSNTDHTGAICAAFFEKDGQWIGGKFDWVSTSRNNRELKHVEYYNNWGSSGIRLPWNGKVAFVVVDKTGRKRSNVLITGN